MKLTERLGLASVEGRTRLACILALFGLAALVLSILCPGALPVIFAMSAGNAIGIVAFLVYLLAILLDTRRSGSERPGPPNGEPHT